MEHPNVTLVRKLYEARARDDRTAIRALLAEDIAWHDPYPPPHGGDLVGVDAVFRDVFEKAGELTGGTTRFLLQDVIADDDLAVALVYWSSSYRGRTMAGKEVAIYRIREGKIVEAWFHPADKAASDAFFADE
jgi:ketosteroid isomerase-like protein